MESAFVHVAGRQTEVRKATDPNANQREYAALCGAANDSRWWTPPTPAGAGLPGKGVLRARPASALHADRRLSGDGHERAQPNGHSDCDR